MKATGAEQPTPQRSGTQGNPITDEVLTKLAAIGLVCPPHVTLRRYLQALTAEGLTAEETASAFLELHQQATYWNGAAVEGRGSDIATRLVVDVLQSVAADDTAVERVCAVLQPAAEVITPRGSRTSTLPSAWGPDHLDEDDPWDEGSALRAEHEPAQDEAPAGSRRWFGWLGRPGSARRWQVLGGAAMTWTLLMIGTGYGAREPIGRLLAYGQARLLGLPSPGQLEVLRRQAGEHPLTPDHWLRYATTADRQGRHLDAIVAYRHYLSLRPDDATVLNSLAWLHCTSDHPWARDPQAALQLAERAHALDQRPNITDTLAEAAYLNGDHARAVTLEEDALSRLTGDDSFYRRQLRKFRQALAEQEQQEQQEENRGPDQ